MTGLQYVLTDAQNGTLNPLAINCLRQFKVYGKVVWGARTLGWQRSSRFAVENIPIRRLALFIESSLYDGTQWVVFEPNDEPLWSQIRLNVGSFMHDLFVKALSRHDAAAGLLRKVRRGEQPAIKHRPWHREHPGRLCAAKARRIRRHPIQQMAGQIQT